MDCYTKATSTSTLSWIGKNSNVNAGGTDERKSTSQPQQQRHLASASRYVECKPFAAWQNLSNTKFCQFDGCDTLFAQASNNCRCCGVVCCAKCLSRSLELPPKYPQPVSVCEHCYNKVVARKAAWEEQRNKVREASTGNGVGIGVGATTGRPSTAPPPVVAQPLALQAEWNSTQLSPQQQQQQPWQSEKRELERRNQLLQQHQQLQLQRKEKDIEKLKQQLQHEVAAKDQQQAQWQAEKQVLEAQNQRLQQEKQQKEKEVEQLKQHYTTAIQQLQQTQAMKEQQLAQKDQLLQRLQQQLELQSIFEDSCPYRVNLARLGHAELQPGIESPPISTSSPFFAHAQRMMQLGGTFDPAARKFRPVNGFTLQHVTVINPPYLTSFRQRIQRLSELRNDAPQHFDPDQKKLGRAHPDQTLLVDQLKSLFLPRPVVGTTQKAANLVNVFHGAKPEYVASVVKGIARVAETDEGYFGTGCYTSNSIEYTASQYSTPRPSDGCRPVVWCVSVVGNAYPVTVNDIDPQRKDGHTKYLGKGLAPGADTHIAPVSSKNNYKVVPVGQMEFLEFVFANEQSLLPIAVLWVK